MLSGPDASIPKPTPRPSPADRHLSRAAAPRRSQLSGPELGRRHPFSLRYRTALSPARTKMVALDLHLGRHLIEDLPQATLAVKTHDDPRRRGVDFHRVV